MIVRYIHGIHSKEGDNNMTALHRAMVDGGRMPAARHELFEYGFMGFWQARWLNNDVARDLSVTSKLGRKHDERELWVTHSNGAAVAYLAVERFGAQPDMIINFNPALDRGLTAGVPRVETIFSGQDRWVDLAQWLPWHVWGDQGRVGYRGGLKNTLSHDAGSFSGPMAYQDHLGAFDPKRISAWATFVALRAHEFLGP